MFRLCVSRGRFASKVVVLLRASFTFCYRKYACRELHHELALCFITLQISSRGTLGSVCIKSDGCAKDILHFLSSEVFLQKTSLCIHTVFYLALGFLRADPLSVSRGPFASTVTVLLWTSFTFCHRKHACRKHHHAFLLCFITLQNSQGETFQVFHGVRSHHK